MNLTTSVPEQTVGIPMDGWTQMVGVIGDPVRHSLSPTIHNAAFDALKLNWRSAAFPVADGEASAAIAAVRALGLRGVSVTMPHKAAVCESLEELAPSAQALGVVNCVSNVDGRLIGHNTDGDGFLRCLADLGVDPTSDGSTVAVVGAGGAARSIVEALGRGGATDIAIVNRTEERARDCATLAGTARVGTEAEIADAAVVVNTTSVGMADDRAIPVNPGLLSSDHTVIDIIYSPAVTPLLAAAVEAGARTANGLSMLVHQAVIQIGLWTGTEPAAAPLLAAAQAVLSDRDAHGR